MTCQQRAEYLAQTYSDAILRLSYTYLKNTSDAQDICQSVFVKLLTQPQEFESAEHERAYILRMAANACKDLLKSPWHKRTCGLEACGDLPAPQAEEGSVLSAVNELPAHYRSVIYLYYYEGYSVKEIAEILRIKETTVQTRLMRARNALREIVKEDWLNE